MNLNRVVLLNRRNISSAFLNKNDVLEKIRVKSLLTTRKLFTSSICADKFSQNVKPEWSRAVSKAEKVVGYPTSFFNLRWLLSDEIANVALQLRKLVGSNHPLLKTAKNLIYNGTNNIQTWGLIVLLVSKAAGHMPTVFDMEQDKVAGVLHTQRTLAEVTEMLRTGNLVHQGILNIQHPSSSKDTSEDMIAGNKMALLGGDFILGNTSAELDKIRNQEVVELISSASRDLVDSQFTGLRDDQNNPLPSRPLKHNKRKTYIKECSDGANNLKPIHIEDAKGNPSAEWALRHILNGGSLLGKACQGTLILGGHSDLMQKQGYLFGKNLALAWQACIDLEPFQSNTLSIDSKFSLVSAPVLFQLEYDPELYTEVEKGFDSIENVDYVKIHSAVLNGPGIARTKELQREYALAASEMLHLFQPSDARTALNNIIVAMQVL